MKTINEQSKERVLSLIPSGESNAINLSEISSYTGFTARRIKAIITELRHTYPICAKETDGGGYWIAEHELDILNFIKMIERHKEGYQKTIDTMLTHVSDKTYNTMQGGKH